MCIRDRDVPRLRHPGDRRLLQRRQPHRRPRRPRHRPGDHQRRHLPDRQGRRHPRAHPARAAIQRAPAFEGDEGSPDRHAGDALPGADGDRAGALRAELERAAPHVARGRGLGAPARVQRAPGLPRGHRSRAALAFRGPHFRAARARGGPPRRPARAPRGPRAGARPDRARP